MFHIGPCGEGLEGDEMFSVGFACNLARSEDVLPEIEWQSPQMSISEASANLLALSIFTLPNALLFGYHHLSEKFSFPIELYAQRRIIHCFIFPSSAPLRCHRAAIKIHLSGGCIGFDVERSREKYFHKSQHFDIEPFALHNSHTVCLILFQCFHRSAHTSLIPKLKRHSRRLWARFGRKDGAKNLLSRMLCVEGNKWTGIYRYVCTYGSLKISLNRLLPKKIKRDVSVSVCICGSVSSSSYRR